MVRRADLGGDVDRGALELGGFHLAGDGAEPDQLVEPGLVVIEHLLDVFGTPREVGRADRLVGLLRVLRLRDVLARRGRHVLFAVVGSDHTAGGRDRLGRDVDAVGSHIGDEADGLAVELDAFIEPLRQPHGVRRREAELAARLLLQRRGHERRIGVAARGLGLDRIDGEGCGFERGLEVLGLFARADVEALDFAAVGADQAGLEGLVARRRQASRPATSIRGRRISRFRARGRDTRRSATDCTRPAERAPGSFRHSTGRQREADQIVERAAGEISVDQRAVDLARVLHRFADRLLGDGVEHDALDGLRLQRVLFLEHFEHVPGDRLALAVGVGGQDQAVGAFDGAGDVVQPLLGLVVDLPEHLEIMVRIDRAILGRKVADMAERSQNLVAGAQILVDRLGLGRRFNDDNFH